MTEAKAHPESGGLLLLRITIFDQNRIVYADSGSDPKVLARRLMDSIEYGVDLTGLVLERSTQNDWEPFVPIVSGWWIRDRSEWRDAFARSPAIRARVAEVGGLLDLMEQVVGNHLTTSARRAISRRWRKYDYGPRLEARRQALVNARVLPDRTAGQGLIASTHASERTVAFSQGSR